MRRLAGLGLVGLLVAGACGPSQDRGPVHRLYLDDDMPSVGGQAGSGGEGGAPDVLPVPPSVVSMKPLSGPYGSEITIEGAGFGSAALAGVQLLLGPDGEGELLPTSRPEVLSWQDSEIRFRFPFPYEGRVLIKTSLGEADAGSFEPTWVAGPALVSQKGVVSIASIAHGSGTIAAVLDSGPPSLVSFDGTAWTEAAIATKNLRADSIRLYSEGATLLAFGLSTATAPEILALDPASDFDATATGVNVTTDYRLAGSADAASVWFRDGQWSRARPNAGTWEVDKEMVNDPNSAGKRHAAGVTSDGSLYVAWAEDIHELLDDRGVVKHRFLASDQAAFAATATTGSEMDDEISSLTIGDRGTGLLIQYCGTNEDPFGVTGNDKLCYQALLPGGTKTTMRENPTLHYGFGPTFQVAAHCSAAKGTRLVPRLGAGGTSPDKLDTLAGDVVTWPCANVLAVEVDPDEEPVLLLEFGGQLYSPRPRAN